MSAVSIFAVLFWLLGLVAGFFLARFFVKRGVGQMKVCNKCAYKLYTAQAKAPNSADFKPFSEFEEIKDIPISRG